MTIQLVFLVCWSTRSLVCSLFDRWLMCFHICFSAYGEALFMSIQTLIIAFLVMLFRDKTLGGVIYTGVYAAILAFLMSPSASMDLLVFLQSSVMPIVVTARVSCLIININRLLSMH